HAAVGFEVVLYPAARERLDDQPRAVGLELLQHVRRGAGRIAHVVQAVEGAHEVVVAAGEVLRSRHLKRRGAIDALLARELTRSRDRGLVVVEAHEGRIRERGGHDRRRRAGAAAEVGHLGAALELLEHAVERGKPLRDQVRRVARAEEALGAGEQAVVVLVPADALAGPERLGQPLLVGEQRGDRVVHPEHVERALGVGEQRLLGQMTVEGDGRSVEAPAGRRAWGLLAWLALHPGPHARGELAARFWPDVLDRSARASLRSAVWALRRDLGDDGGRHVVASRDQVELDGDVWVDARAFEALLAEGELQRAIELCGGELLPGFDDEWALRARDEHREREIDALERLAEESEPKQA